MPKYSGVAVVVAVSFIVVSTMNLSMSLRDGSLTVGISSFEVEEIISKRLWAEHPVQTMHTFVGARTILLGAGLPDTGGLDFGERLQNSGGGYEVDLQSNPIDLRFIPDQELLKQLVAFFELASYRTNLPCPHDPENTCSIGLGWNRETPKNAPKTMITSRIGETEYLLFDESIVIESYEGDQVTLGEYGD